MILSHIQEQIIEDLQDRYSTIKESVDSERMSALYFEATEMAQDLSVTPATFWRVYIQQDTRR